MWAILAVILLVNNAAGSVLPRTRSSIVRGERAPEGRYPWAVNLWITNGIVNWQCGGSLLTAEWVLTAAHCLRTESLPPLTKFSFAQLGTTDLEKPPEFYRGLSEFVVHPDYNSVEHDIALVKLEEAVTFSSLVSPVLLPVEGEVFTPEAECWITGFDKPFYFIPTYYLQQLSVNIMEQSVCEDQVRNLTSNMLCADSREYYAGACNGDAGGSLVCRSACGFIQVGIISGQYADYCGDESPGVYTRVSRYMDFINNATECNPEGSGDI